MDEVAILTARVNSLEGDVQRLDAFGIKADLSTQKTVVDALAATVSEVSATLSKVQRDVASLVARKSAGVTPAVLQAIAEPVADKLNEVSDKFEKDLRNVKSGVVSIASESREASRASAEIVKDTLLGFAARWTERS